MRATAGIPMSVTMDGVLTLYQFPAAPALGLGCSESPPCAKVEVYLRLAGVPHELAVGDPRKSPTKMVPFVRWPDGALQAESGDIIDRLEAERGLDRVLDPERVQRARAFAREAEPILYDAVLYDRFTNPEGARLQRPLSVALLERFMPRALAKVAAIYIDNKQARKARRGVMADPAAGEARAIALLDDMVDMLGTQPYLAGEHPCTADCGLWPHVAHAAATLNLTPLRDAARSRPTLTAWAARFGERIGMPVQLDAL